MKHLYYDPNGLHIIELYGAGMRELREGKHKTYWLSTGEIIKRWRDRVASREEWLAALIRGNLRRADLSGAKLDGANK